MYMVETYTELDGWADIWSVDDVPQRFRTKAEAQEEIDEHISDCIAAGMDTDEFRIVVV